MQQEHEHGKLHRQKNKQQHKAQHAGQKVTCTSTEHAPSCNQAVCVLQILELTRLEASLKSLTCLRTSCDTIVHVQCMAKLDSNTAEVDLHEAQLLLGFLGLLGHLVTRLACSRSCLHHSRVMLRHLEGRSDFMESHHKCRRTLNFVIQWGCGEGRSYFMEGLHQCRRTPNCIMTAPSRGAMK